jgi:hypothetical protein
VNGVTLSGRARMGRSPGWFHFLRHLGEMTLAMMFGMMVSAAFFLTVVEMNLL